MVVHNKREIILNKEDLQKEISETLIKDGSRLLLHPFPITPEFKRKMQEIIRDEDPEEYDRRMKMDKLRKTANRRMLKR